MNSHPGCRFVTEGDSADFQYYAEHLERSNMGLRDSTTPLGDHPHAMGPGVYPIMYFVLIASIVISCVALRKKR